MDVIDATCPLVHEIHHEVKKLHIEIDSWHNKEGGQEVLSFRIIGVGSFFPPISPEAYEEIDDWDESFRSKGYDCSYEEIWEELRTKVREWFEGGRSDWMEVEMEYEEMADEDMNDGTEQKTDDKDKVISEQSIEN